MRKFIQGTFELDYDVKDLISYEELHKTALENIIDWLEQECKFVL